MDLSGIKMVVSDMDGTLLNSKHEVSSRFFEQFQELKKKGILFVAASGRQYHSIKDKLNTIQDDIIIVAENGALVKEREKELLVTPLRQSLRNSLLEKIDNIEGAHAMLCGKYTSYLDGKSVSFLEQLKEYYSDYEIHDDFQQIDAEILKVAVYHSESAEEYIYPAIKTLENKITVKVSGLNWVDLNHLNANKGFAVKHLMDLRGIGPNEVLVFGDYNNDLEMLDVSDFSFAMENAHPNVKAVAKHTTTSNDDFGVERVLEQLLKQIRITTN